MIANDVFRGRFRGGLSTPKPLTPGAVLDYDIDLHAASHVFRKGHRVAVQIQSSWFPLIDRNPQTFVPNIFNAKPADFKAQTHTVFHDPSHPSAIAVSVATDDKQP
jgi:predicted acyl esterase